MVLKSVFTSVVSLSSSILSLGKREMLWIEYDSCKVEKAMAEDIANLIGVVPVAVKDWNNEVGPLAINASDELDSELPNHDQVNAHIHPTPETQRFQTHNIFNGSPWDPGVAECSSGSMNKG